MTSDLEAGEDKLFEMLSQAEELENCKFIIVDNASKMKNHEYDEWYKRYVQGDTGIWIGNGVDDQYVIRINTIGNDIIKNCGSSFGYVIDQSEPTMVKLLGIREDGENYE